MALEVKIWGNTIGHLNWDVSANAAVFRYQNSFLDSGLQISPIALPISPQLYMFRDLPRNVFKGLPGVFADSLPDKFGEGLMNEYFKSKSFGLSELTPLDRLAYIGDRGMGAITYHPAEEMNHLQRSISLNELEALADFGIRRAAKLETELHPNETEGFQDILSIGTSAGGARPKAVIAWNEVTNEIKSGQLDHAGFQHWLIKLDVQGNQRTLGDPQGYGRIEYTYFQLASEAGIEMMESRLLTEGNRGHFMTKRFDRVNDDTIHVHSLNGLAHINYENVMEHSYGSLLKVANGLSCSVKEKDQLFRRMVFNVVMRNCDDHTKNFSFQMDRSGLWSITPAYDICYSYDSANEWVNGHMKINGKRQNITAKDLCIEARSFGVRKPEGIIAEILEVSSKWNSRAIENGVPKPLVGLIQKELNEVKSELRFSLNKGMQL